MRALKHLAGLCLALSILLISCHKYDLGDFPGLTPITPVQICKDGELKTVKALYLGHWMDKGWTELIDQDGDGYVTLENSCDFPVDCDDEDAEIKGCPGCVELEGVLGSSLTDFIALYPAATSIEYGLDISLFGICYPYYIGIKSENETLVEIYLRTILIGQTQNYWWFAYDYETKERLTQLVQPGYVDATPFYPQDCIDLVNAEIARIDTPTMLLDSSCN